MIHTKVTKVIAQKLLWKNSARCNEKVNSVAGAVLSYEGDLFRLSRLETGTALLAPKHSELLPHNTVNYTSLNPQSNYYRCILIHPITDILINILPESKFHFWLSEGETARVFFGSCFQDKTELSHG